MIDTETYFSEVKLLADRRPSTVMAAVDGNWIYKHVAPRYISSYDKLNLTKIKSDLTRREIRFISRSTRLHNKLGIVER